MIDLHFIYIGLGTLMVSLCNLCVGIYSCRLKRHELEEKAKRYGKQRRCCHEKENT